MLLPGPRNYMRMLHSDRADQLLLCVSFDRTQASGVYSYRHRSRSKHGGNNNYKTKSTSYSSRSITESSESDFISYKRPYEWSDDDFSKSKRLKRHQSCANDRHQSSATDKHQSRATDKYQSRAVDMPQNSAQTCCNNTEPDMSRERSAGPSAHEPSQDDFITLHP